MALWWVISLLWNWGIYLSRPTICKPYANPLFWCIVQNMHHSPDGLLMMGFVQVSSFGTITINPWTGIDPDKESLFGEFLTGFQLLVIWCYMYIIYTRYIALHAFIIFMTSNRDFSLPSDVFLKIFRHSFHANDSTHACRSTTSSPSKSFNDELLDATCNRGTCPGVVADAMAVTMEAASKKVTKSHSNRDN